MTTRRDFIKFIVAGSIASGCPLDQVLCAEPSLPAEIDGEHNAICHEVRDGHSFPRPAVSRRVEVVIAGGGISGLSAAYFLHDRDFLLLEKEDHWGGNAYLEQYQGMPFATGAAFTDLSEAPAMNIAREIGFPPLRVDDPDGTIVQGEFVADTWRAGLDHLPYPESVRASFRKFRQDVLAIPFAGHELELDRRPFAEFFRGYAPEVKLWWDTYGPSNWGARTEETSAMIGIGEMRHIAGEQPDRRVTWPGGLGALTRGLSEKLVRENRDQMMAGATIVAVEQEKSGVRVTYIDSEGHAQAVEAKAAIMATPKFITRRVVAGLPAAQDAAMKRLRYIPYPVVNLIFAKPVFNQGYDTWCPSNRFTDFVVADWTVRKQPNYRQKYNILTFYTPLTEAERPLLLTDEGSRQVAAEVLRDFQKLFPGSNADPLEVHLYRRGHPLYVSLPGNFSEVQPLVRRPVGRIFFANTDSEGPVSDTSQGIAAALRAVRELNESEQS